MTFGPDILQDYCCTQSGLLFFIINGMMCVMLIVICAGMVFFAYPMVMLMMVKILFLCDKREDCFHQVKVVDPSHQYQHLVYVVWRSFLMAVI